MTRRKKLFRSAPPLWAWAVLFIPSAVAGEYRLDVQSDKPDAIYASDEEIAFTVTVLRDGQPLRGEGTLSCRIAGDLIRAPAAVDPPTLAFPLDGLPKTVTARLDRPGWVLLEAALLDPEGRPVKHRPQGKTEDIPVVGLGGAVVAPLELRAALPEPPGFDAFWKACRAEADDTPWQAVEKEVPTPQPGQEETFRCYDVRVDCPGGRPVTGYLGFPADARPKSLPALVTFNGAGVRSANKRVRPGVLLFDVNAHGTENGQPPEYYAAIAGGELKSYARQGIESPRTSYFRGLFLRVMRALQYVKSRPEWDGRTLVVQGGSMGGAQALAAAMLDPDVVLCVAEVPAMGDHGALLAGRTAGWPHTVSFKKMSAASLERARSLLDTLAYFDTVNFARRIRCETFISTGFVDTICPPTSAYLVYLNLPADTIKSIQARPHGGHNSSSREGRARIDRLLAGTAPRD